MTPDRGIAFIVPEGAHDEAHPTGGNIYDRRLAAALGQYGWAVDTREVTVGSAGSDGVAAALAGLPDGCTVLVDGLLAAPDAHALSEQAARLRLVLVMHMTMACAPPGHDRPGAEAAERAVLARAAGVLATSDWLRQQLVTRQRVDPRRVTVAPPGVGPAPVTRGSPSGNRLLCVAPVAPHKGHDVLMAALGRCADLDWTCVCAGSLHRDAAFAATVRADAARAGIGERVRFAGVRTRSELADDYAASDLLVLPTRSESYGMVITEALARGLPVLACDVGGVAEAATGRSTGAGIGDVPGALVTPDDPGALAGELRRWLTDAGTRAAWRRRAGQRRLSLTGWDRTARRAAAALEGAAPPRRR